MGIPFPNWFVLYYKRDETSSRHFFISVLGYKTNSLYHSSEAVIAEDLHRSQALQIAIWQVSAPGFVKYAMVRLGSVSWDL